MIETQFLFPSAYLKSEKSKGLRGFFLANLEPQEGFPDYIVCRS